MGYPEENGMGASGMKLAVTGALVLTLVVSGCAKVRDSKFNPVNWFGRSKAVATAPANPVVPGRPDDGRLLVDQVTELEVARQPGGAIVRASGLPPTQGWWDAALVPENDGLAVDGVITYRFVVAAPPKAKRVSTPQSRELTAAIFLSDMRLQDVRQIVVVGTQNSRSVRR
ncbi:MAG: hypothetical protein KDJ23_02595 [Rhodoblastus sp.]|nr:hypothetical protein [Rhodoblastus sp.]